MQFADKISGFECVERIRHGSSVMDNVTMADDPAQPGQDDPGRTWRPAFVRGIAVVGLWHLVPAAEVATGWLVVSQASPCVDGCGWGALIVAGHLALLVLSLLLGTITVAALSALGRNRPGLRRPAVTGHIGAIPGIALSAFATVWLVIWVRAAAGR